MTQPPPDQQPTQHAPQRPPVPPQQPQGQQWPVAQPPVAQPPNPYASGSGAPYQQQPPYGQPYGQQPYQPPFQQPPSSGGAGKAIAIIVAAIILVVLLFCGGIIALIFWIAGNVEDSVNEWDADRVGGRDNPITVEMGEAFEIDGVEYAEGWSVQPPADNYSGHSVTGLTATNEREDGSSKYVSLSFTFVAADDVEVAEISCYSDGSISNGNSEDLECRGYDEITATYDHIEVSAS
ncbi:hypothetical protein ASE01_04920 [Nocardioides sp. Root190]|uniref:hypothetical protein n=1 Tax=Nocardioides sp. Root190 TaxID=1736488 RepID=UPI0006FB2C02|nr:hypothetical protein [Nocardioides sp. Root190]KRB78596.1 hypothetical protein ASE01_04920 [Nocardioides sp. Root190]